MRFFEPRVTVMGKRVGIGFLALALVAGLAAPAVAQERSMSPLSFLNLRSSPIEAPDFVRNSRPAEMDFVPVHSQRPEPAGKALTPAQIRAQEAQLDALRRDHDQLAGRKAVAGTYKPLAAEPKPKPKAAERCVGYCQAKGAILPGR